MSTAKNRTVKYTAFVTVLIVTLSYFSLLSPTSAYFYKTNDDKQTTIEFAKFDVKEEQVIFSSETPIVLKGATKLADFDELLFDDVADEKEVILENKGDTPARILAHITPTDESVANGLKYIAFIEEITDSTSSLSDGEEDTYTPVEKGSIKKELESKFNITAVPESLTGTEKKEYESSVAASVATQLDTDNEAFKNEFVTIAPGQKAKVRVIFWAEYDTVQSENGGESVWQEAGSVKDVIYECHIEIIASQDTDDAVNSLFTAAE